MRHTFRLIPALLAAAVSAGAQQADGRVMGITGKWWDAGMAVLHFGSPVGTDATLKCAAESTILVGGSGLRIYGRCDRSGQFHLKDAPRQAEPKGLFDRLRAAVEPYGRRSPEGLIAAVSRDFGREVREAAVPLRNGQVDVAPAFRDALPGAYQVRLAPLAGGQPVVFQAQWAAGQPLPIPAPNLKPGLHRLAVLEEGGRVGSEAWVLVCAAGEYAPVSADFQQAIDLTSKWADDLDAAAVRPVLRAYLESLAKVNRP
jgi:hypothetical protein